MQPTETVARKSPLTEALPSARPSDPLQAWADLDLVAEL